MSNIPKLRFPEFKGEWEEKRIDSIFDEKKEKNHPSEDVLTIIQGTGTVPRKESGRNIIFDEKSLSNYKFVQKDDFIIHLRSFEGGLEIANSNGIVSPAYIIMHPKLSIASKFYYSYFRSYKFINHVLPVSVEGVRDGRQIKYPILKEEKIPFTSFGEQQKIADFLSNVDSIITAETKILNTLQKKKKALMQKLFTRQLRFKSDDGTDFPAWEEKKFSEVFIYHQTNTFSRNMLNYEEGDTYNIHYGDILVKFGSYIDFDNSKIPFINSDVTLNKFVSDSFLKDGDIIIADTAEDESAGKVSEVYNINNKKALSGLHTILCRPKQIFASKYLGYFMNSNVYHKQIVKLLVGTKVLSINKSVIADTIIQIPCLAEQQKIADCLSSMDSLIQTQQKVVTTWQQRKKALLQQMFV